MHHWKRIVKTISTVYRSSKSAERFQSTKPVCPEKKESAFTNYGADTQVHTIFNSLNSQHLHLVERSPISHMKGLLWDMDMHYLVFWNSEGVRVIWPLKVTHFCVNAITFRVILIDCEAFSLHYSVIFLQEDAHSIFLRIFRYSPKEV